jgi:uncharacterized protein
VNKILIAAIAGRMLATSAQRGGYDIAVLDLFNDLDTRQIALCSRKVAGHEQGLARFDRQALLEAASCLAPSHAYPGLVYGSGFENDTELLDRLADDRRLFGNSTAVVRRTKDPLHFFSLLKKWAIPHPDIATNRPDDPSGWLAKKIGGSGGAHVTRADELSDPDSQHYFQRFVEGKNYSVSFLADGERAVVVGFNEPWSIALGDWPFCYLGAINHVPLPTVMTERVQRDLNVIVRETELVGLNGMDFIVSGENYFVIEVNPRPSGTLDLYDADCPEGLFHWHTQASDGVMPARLLTQKTIRAHAVVYTDRPFALAPDVQWPSWCSDIPEPGSRFEARMPVCMVHAAGEDHEQVRALLHSRREKMFTEIQLRTT